MIALVFPGQGSQKVGMGRALAEAFPAARQTFAEADEALGEPLSRLIWDGPEDALMLTENTQPSILTASIAAYRALESEGLTVEASRSWQGTASGSTRPTSPRARSRLPTPSERCGAGAATCRRPCRSELAPCRPSSAWMPTR